MSVKYYDMSNIETPSVQKYIDRAREQLIDAQRRLQNNGDEALKENINAALFYVMEVYAMQTMKKLRDSINKSYC